MSGVRAAGEPSCDSHATPSRTVSTARAYVPIDEGAVYATLTDRVDPQLVHAIEAAVRNVDGVEDVHDVRARYAGRALYVVLNVSLPPDMPLYCPACARHRADENSENPKA